MDNKEQPNLTDLQMADEKAAEDFLFKQAKVELNIESQLLPPTDVWQDIEMQISVLEKESQPKHSLSKKRSITWGISMAASFILMSVGWLMWSNYHLQGQLQQVILANQYLELQLERETTPTFNQTLLVSKISELENKLYYSNNDKEMLALLMARKKLIQQIIELQKEENHEYSI